MSAPFDPLLLEMPMPIRTPRLLIRPRQPGDGAALARAVDESRDYLRPWLPFVKNLQTPEQVESHCRKAAAEFMLRENFTLSIFLADGQGGEKTLVGSTGLHKPNWEVRSFHIGYWMHPKHAGQGYVTESTHALTRYAFEVMKARRVEIRCDALNAPSLAVMKRLGYVEEGRFKSDDLNSEGEPRDTIITARTSLDGLPPLEVRW